LLVRFARRLANWEEELPVEELQKREFKARNGGPDLRPSVYELDPAQTHRVRAYAEHAVGLDPPATALGLDLTEPQRPIDPTAGSPRFQFIRERHREIVLEDAGALHAFIREILVNLGERKHQVTRQEVVAYVRERLQAADEEWTLAAGERDAKAWLVKLRPA